MTKNLSQDFTNSVSKHNEENEKGIEALRWWYLYFCSLCHQYALKDFREVPEVEGVMGFGRCRQQSRCDGGVNPDGGIHQWFIQRLNFWTFLYGSEK